MSIQKKSGSFRNTGKVDAYERKIAADYIKHVAEITLTLEGGVKATLYPEVETAIPSEPLAQIKALMKAPAQLAFWGYQTERASKAMRDAERSLSRVEGEKSLVYRKWYQDHLETKYTEDMIRSRLAMDDDVDQEKIKLNEARDLYGILRATRDAVEHRVYALRKLIGPDSTATKG